MSIGDRSESAIAYNGTTGDYLVVWDYHAGEYNWDIYGQRVSSSGELVGSEIAISTATLGQFFPAIAYNSANGEYLVVWEDLRNGSTKDIYGQRVSSSGALLGSNFSISTAAEGQYYSAVAYDSTSGEYLVVWGDGRNGHSNYDIYGQRVSSSGALVDSNFPISTASGNQYYPEVTHNSANGEYLVVWQDPRDGSSTQDIYGQRVSGGGALVGSNFPISTASGIQAAPVVRANSANGEYLVVWLDPRGGSDIYGQRVSSIGALLGSEIAISTASGGQAFPEVAYSSANGEYLVVWADARSGSVDIYGQKVAGTGTLVGSDFPISTASLNQDQPVVSYNSANGEYLVTWTDDSGDNRHIYGQRVSGSGALEGGEIPITDNTPRPTATPVLPTATSIPPTPCPGQFCDVPPGSTFYPFITCLVERGIISGYADGTFRPNNEITRGQLSKIVSNAAGYSEAHTEQTFSDVPPDSTFYIFIERMASRGIIGGYTDGTFRPNNIATRGQIAKVVSNAQGYSETPTGQTFSDVPPDSTFYLFVERIASRGFIGGYADGTFRPNNIATRGQTSKIVANAFFPECQSR